MKRTVSVLLAVLTVMMLLSSCSQKGAGKKISYPLAESPSTLDPQFAADSGAQTVINNTFEGLVRLDENGEVIPGIAESWSVSGDGRVYTFKLKKDTEWYCPSTMKKEYGEDFYNHFSSVKVTASDFVFACRRAITLRGGSTHAHRLFVIENASDIFAERMSADKLGVTAPDDTTLVIKLVSACPDFLERLTECEFMPCNEEFFNAMGGRYGLSNKHILCNGPFYVSSWEPESSLTIKANKYYAGEKDVLPMSVTFSFDNSLESIEKKLSTAAYLAAFLPPDSEMPENSHKVSEKENAVFGFCFNCSDSFLQNKNLRLALCASVNRNLFAPVGDNTKPQFGFIPAVCSCGGTSYREAVNGQIPMVKYSEADAAGYWQAALTELETDKISLNLICPEWLEAPVKQQLQLWQKIIGIDFGITAQCKTVAEINEAVAAGDYQIALTGIESEFTDAPDFVSSLNDGGIFRFDTSEFAVIADKLKKVENDSELTGGCFTAERYIIESGICLPLYSRAGRLIESDDAGGIYMSGSENAVCFISAKRFD